jgi:hypothetical protein
MATNQSFVGQNQSTQPFDKKQYLLSHGYNEEEANLMIGGIRAGSKYQPMQIGQPVQDTVREKITISPNSLQELRTIGKTDDFIADEMAAKNAHFASQLQKIRKKFNGDPAATSAFLNTRFYGDTTYTPPSEAVQKPKGYVGRTLDRIYTKAEDILGEDGITDQMNRGEITSGQAALRGASKIFGGALAPVTEGVSTIAGGIYENVPGIKEGLGYLGSEISESKLGQAATPYVQDIAQGYQNLPQGSGYRDLAAVGQAGLDVLDVVGAQAGMNIGKRALSQATRPIQTIRHPLQSAKGVLTGSQQTSGAAVAQGERKLAGKAKEAVSKGLDEPTVTFLAEQNADTRAVMAKMTRAAEEGSKKMSGTVRHKEILGGQMLENTAYILDEKGAVGKALGAMKKAVYGEVSNLTDDYHEFLQVLRDKGAVISDKGKITALAGAADDNIPQLQRILDFLIPDESGRVVKSGKDIDMWRAKMFEEMDSAKAKLQPSKSGQSSLDFADKITNNVRRRALIRMAKGNVNMIRANDAFEELSTATSNFLKSIGYKGKLTPDAITAKQLRAGEIAMRTLGNASAETRDAFQELINTAKKYGRASNVDDMALVEYTRALEDIFPIARPQSLRGQVARGTRDAAGNILEDISRGGSAKSGILNRVSEPVMATYDKMRGLTPENRFKLLMEILESPDDAQFFTIINKALPEGVADDLIDDIGKKRVQKMDAEDLKPMAIEKQLDDTQFLAPEPDDLLTQPAIDDFGKGKELYKSAGFDEAQARFDAGTLPSGASDDILSGGSDSVKAVSKADDLTSSIQKAKASGQSFDEWVKGEGEAVYHGGTKIDEVGNMRSKWGSFYMTDNPTYAKSYGGNKSILNEMVITTEAKLADLRKPSADIIKQIDEIISPKATGETLKIEKPDGTFVEVPKTKGGLSNPVHSSADIIQGIKDGKAYYAEMPEVKKALKKLGYDGMITQESKFGANYGVWNKNVIKTRSQLKAEWEKVNPKK